MSWLLKMVYDLVVRIPVYFVNRAGRRWPGNQQPPFGGPADPHRSSSEHGAFEVWEVDVKKLILDSGVSFPSAGPYVVIVQQTCSLRLPQCRMRARPPSLAVDTFAFEQWNRSSEKPHHQGNQAEQVQQPHQRRSCWWSAMYGRSLSPVSREFCSSDAIEISIDFLLSYQSHGLS
jgi:hypothetical protein